jgi:hypothetical protein
MSCHGTPGNSFATSLACAFTATPSDEVSRRFHTLKKENPDAPPPDETTVLAWLDRQETAVRADEELSAYRRARLQHLLAVARDSIHAGALPDGPTWHAWQDVRATCDDAHVYAWLAHQSGTTLPLTEKTPADIDEQLGALWDRIHEAEQRKRGAVAHLSDLRTGRRYRQPATEGQLARAAAAVDAAEATRAAAAVDAAEATLVGLLDQTEPLNAEYQRRGRWARFFRVVTSGEGHVHSSMNCHTCYPTTRYMWLPSLSGKGQDEAVDAYGSEMCSICFPTVLTHPSYQTRGAIAEASAARRAQENAARQAIKDAKGITNPDGTPVLLGRGRYRDRIGSAVTAERELISRLVDLRTDMTDDAIEAHVTLWARTRRDSPPDPQAAANEHRARLLERRAETEADIAVLTQALSHKAHLTPEELAASVEERVARKTRKVFRDRARLG